MNNVPRYKLLITTNNKQIKMCGKLKFQFQKHGVKVSVLKLGFEKNFETWIQNVQKFKTCYGLNKMFQA
jgi:hypothetical protein